MIDTDAAHGRKWRPCHIITGTKQAQTFYQPPQSYTKHHGRIWYIQARVE